MPPSKYDIVNRVRQLEGDLLPILEERDRYKAALERIASDPYNLDSLDAADIAGKALGGPRGQ